MREINKTSVLYTAFKISIENITSAIASKDDNALQEHLKEHNSLKQDQINCGAATKEYMEAYENTAIKDAGLTRKDLKL